MEPDLHDRLGTAEIQDDADAVVVPREAFDLDLVEDGEVHWATSDEDVLVVSASEDSLTGEEGLDVFASSTVDDGRTLEIPAAAFEEWGDVSGGDTLYFVSTDEMETEDQCLVVPESQAREIDLLED